MTDRQTKASSGRVVSMFKPKHLFNVNIDKHGNAPVVPYSRAMLTRMLSAGKLLSTFPCVFDPKDRKPARPIARHMHKETIVE